MINHPLKQQRGAALIIVLIIVFIVMTIVTNLTVKNYRVIRRLTNQKIMDQCSGILLVAIDFGRAGLATTGSTSKIDTLNDLWAQPLPRTKIMDDIEMSGYLTDEQGKFNINDLTANNGQINQTVLKQFTQLLLYLNIPSALATNIAYYMAAPQYQGDIITQYTSGSPPYRPAGKPLVDLSELMLVQGMQPQWVYKLSQYVTVIPQSIDGLIQNQQESGGQNQQESGGQSQQESSTANQSAPTGTGTVLVNVNTASAEVIAAKSGIPLPTAQRMTTIRNSTPFKTQQDITKFLTSNGIMLSQNSSKGTATVNPGTLTTQSNYFAAHAVVDKGDYEFKWVALLYRANRSGQWPQILWQHPE